MQGGIVQGIDDSGKPRVLGVTPEGRAKIENDSDEQLTAGLLRSLIAETQELRRVLCNATGVIFIDL